MTVDPDRLDELMEQAPYLDDDGFTARVMGALPSPRRDLGPLVRALSFGAAGVTALVVLPGAVEAGLRLLATLALPEPVAPGLVLGAAAALLVAAVAGLVVALEG